MIKNPEDLVVFTGATQIPASLNSPIASHKFAFNPDEVKWKLSNNTVSRDTIGGRVVQLLSSKVEQMTVIGRAGSRGELQNLAINLKKIMEYQVKTQYPVNFKVPSRKWNFKVYVQNVSSLGWDFATTSYPYELTLLVQEDLTGLSKKTVEREALERLREGIGYVDGFHGGSAEDALSTSETYLNSQTFLKNKKNKDGTLVESELETAGGTGEVPLYGTASGSLAAGVQFYMNIPAKTFQMHTGYVPQFVKDNPYLYRWSKNGNTATFQKDAMMSFIKVVADSGLAWIANVSTFRTYEQQVAIYADKPDLAAKPGTSYHELGIAIDVHENYRNNPRVINAFSNNGWNRFSPSREPWHWSYKVTG